MYIILFQKMSPQSVAELKAEPCPELCGAEMLELLDPTKEKFSRTRLVVVDIREPELYPLSISFCRKMY